MMLDKAGKSDLSSLEKCVSAGEPLPLPTFEAWQGRTGLRIIDGIGATEMLHIFISASGEAIRPGATGRPIPGYQAMVVDDEMRPLPQGEIGRLAVRGPTGCRYLADDRQKEYVRDGWNLTGDAYMVDRDGYFWFQARTDDMIISAGYNVAGPEVEEALLEHDAVAECAVVSTPDPVRGQIVKAFVVPRQGMAGSDALRKELQEFVKQRIAAYKYPRAIEFLDALPRTETGKVQRFRLRQIEVERAAAPAA
jgi:2-aminobenzoate-CoA ligase